MEKKIKNKVGKIFHLHCKEFYLKTPKYSDTRIIAVIILKFEQSGSSIE